MKNLNIFALGLLLLAGCAKDLGYQQTIQGKWQAVSWTSENDVHAPRRTDNVAFDFNGEKYSANLGARDESGSFRIEEDKLYTHAEGQQEIMVKIVRLTADSLLFEMNRGGVKELLTLARPNSSIPQ